MSATSTGKKVLANLALAREVRNAARRERARFFMRVIADYVLIDIADGWSAWGRSARIKRKLMKADVSERTIRKYLAAVVTTSEYTRYGASSNHGGPHYV